MKDYFVFLKPIDDESKKILSDKEYKNNKSIAQMWRDSIV